MGTWNNARCSNLNEPQTLNDILLDVRGGNRAVRRPLNPMIEFAKAYKVGDKVFTTLAEAQTHELVTLIESIDANDNEVLAVELVKHADKVIDILSTTATSRPKARRLNGGTKKRKAKSDGALADML